MPSKTKPSSSSATAAAAAAEKPIIATPSSSQIGVSNSNVDSAQLLKAFRALSAHSSRRKATSSGALPLDGPAGDLRDPSNAVYLQITLNVLSPTSHVKPVRVNVPHALHVPGEVSVCLLVKDPQREYKDLLVERNIKCITRVVGVSKMKGKFKPYDARRALVQDHDIFLADSRIVPTLPNLCGKVFFDAKKNPITVNIAKNADALKAELEAAIKATTFLQNKGSCTTVKVGYMASHTPEQLTENVLAALPAVLSRVKGGWENVHNIDVKLGNSAALPVWNAKLGVKTHVTPSSASKRGADAEEEEEEEGTPSKKKAAKGEKSPVKKVVDEEKVKSPSPRKTRSAAAAKASTAIEQAATPTKATPKKNAASSDTPKKSTSSVSRSARKVK